MSDGLGYKELALLQATSGWEVLTLVSLSLITIIMKGEKVKMQTNELIWSKRPVSWTMGLTLALLFASGGARAEREFRFVPVDAPGSVFFTGILGINNHGDIVGVRDGADGRAHGFLRRAGGQSFITIDFPGAISSNASQVSDNGDIVGTYFDSTGFQHGYLLHDDRFTSIDVPDAAQLKGINFEFGDGLGTAVFRINDLGAVVGAYADPDGFAHGFVLRKGRFHDIDVPGVDKSAGLGTTAVAINDRGVVTGLYFTNDAPPAHGFVLNRRHFSTIDFPHAAGSFGTQANGVNNHGDVVGPYSDQLDHIHGYLLHDGEFTPLDFPGAPDSECDGINDRGVIIGQYTDAGGVTHGYIATPRQDRVGLDARQKKLSVLFDP